MTKIKGENVGRATIIVMITLFASRVLGFVREMIVATVFGAGIKSDAFYAAFAIPDLMFDLLIAGALSAGFMPVFTGALAKDEEDEAWKAANTFITVAVIVILVFNVFGSIFARYLIPLVAVGSVSDKEKFDLTVSLTRIMLPAVTLTVIAGLSRGILNSYKRFRAPAWGPVAYNLGIIFGAWFLTKRFGIYGMAIGVIIGAALNVLVQLPEFTRVGSRFKFELNLDNTGFKRMLFLMGPSIVGLAIVRINLIVNQNIASLLDPGSITSLRFAQRIMLLPVGIFAASVSTTIFPTMAALVARKETEDFKKTFSLGLRVLTFISIPASIGLIVLSTPIVRLLFRQGNFTEASVKITAFALAFYSIGIIGQSLVPIVIRGFYSIQDTKTPVKIGFIVLILNVILNLSFVKFSTLAIGGIAFSSSLTSIAELIMLYVMLGRKFNRLRTKELFESGIKSLIASLVMGGAAYASYRMLDGMLGHVSKIAQLADIAVSVTIGCSIFLAAAHFLKMNELDYVVSVVRRKVKKAA